MATFLQNIAPAISDVGTGYLKGAANTQEKYRQEELTRQKDALETYNKLISSGHWKVVDPEKGASGPGVMSIGGVGWLEPVEIPAWEKAKYEQEEQERQLKLKTAELSASSHEATLASQMEGMLQSGEIHKLNLQTAQAHLATAKEGTKQASEKKATDRSKVYIKNPQTGELIGEIPLDDYEEAKTKLDKAGIPFTLGKPTTTKEPTSGERDAPHQLDNDIWSVINVDKKIQPIPDMSALDNIDKKARAYGYGVYNVRLKDKKGNLKFVVPFIVPKNESPSVNTMARRLRSWYGLSNSDIAMYLKQSPEVIAAILGK